MSLTGQYNSYLSFLANPVPVKPAPAVRGKRQAPFSLRLTDDERRRLTREAKGAPLGGYIKAKVLGTPLPLRTRQTGLSVHDRESLGKVLALLGASRIPNNLNQLAFLANTGSLPMTPETEAELKAAVREVRSMRALLMKALGMKAGTKR